MIHFFACCDKTHMLVIPNEVRDLTVGDGSHKLLCLINQLM